LFKKGNTVQDFPLDFCPSFSAPSHRFRQSRVRRIPSFIFALLLLCVASRTPAQPADTSGMRTLSNHHPQWANAQNDAGALPASQTVDNLTIVLARTPEQEAAFRQFTEDQQNPASPSYHHWLSPQQINQRFGPSQDQIAAVSSWLQSQNLTVRWIAPSGGFLGFSGAAADLGRALHAELHTYTVHGAPRISVASDPVLPAALAANIRAIRGLYTIEDKPLHSARTISSDAPEVTTGSGSHYLGPQDFNTIYNVPNGDTGVGQTIGIVGRSRTDFADFDNLRQKTGATFANPTEVVPTSFGGVDPGPAYTTPQPSSVNLDDQLEAELDVLRAGSVAPAANLLLVAATNQSGGIAASAQYLVQTTPIPANSMNISFGACEDEVSTNDLLYWDNLFQQAAAEGISVFVSSGDSGASGCDTSFQPPPANPDPNSPNYICASSYDTCVGGTEFNDIASPALYWNSTNGGGLNSAIGYIPEGGWNEPLDLNSVPQLAASGGGTSYLSPPSWQKFNGQGLPGRYSPDIAFSASGHDGYFACFAAAGASCVPDTSGEYNFEYFFGTSAAAPSMAGIAALLDQKLGQAQGNLNPELYALAASTPSVFHDVTVASSGVANCQVATPSMCNNSAPGPTMLTGGQSGYLVTDGFDLVTGLGSLNVANFLNSYTAPPAIRVSSTNITFQSQMVGNTGKAQVTVQNVGNADLDEIIISSSGELDGGFDETDNCRVTLAAGTTCTIQFTFTPTAAGSWFSEFGLFSQNAQNTVVINLYGSAVTANSPTTTPLISVTPATTTLSAAQSFSVNILMSRPATGLPAPTGTVIVSSGSFASAPATLASADSSFAAITIPANSLTAGTDTLTAAYTPDASSALFYTSATATASVTVTPPPSIAITATNVTLKAGAATGNTSTITVTPTGGFTGNVSLEAGISNSSASGADIPTASFTGSGNVATINVTGTAPVTTTLTITTQALVPQSAHADHNLPWPLAGGASLASLLLLGIPGRLRRARRFVGAALLFLAFIGTTIACGGGSSYSTPLPPKDPGTPAGTYTVTITAKTGTATIASTTFTLTVQ
jgi:subtilase family serine protease